MSVIVHAGPEWDELARRLNDRKARTRAETKAVNKAGGQLRRTIYAALSEVIPGSKKAFGIKGRAAHARRQGDPQYNLSLSQAISISKLKGQARRFEKRAARGGTTFGRFSFVDADGELQTFRAVFRSGKGRGAGFKLSKAGELKERFLGGVKLRRTAFEDPSEGGYAPLAHERKRTERELLDAMADELGKALAGRNRSV